MAVTLNLNTVTLYPAVLTSISARDICSILTHACMCYITNIQKSMFLKKDNDSSSSGANWVPILTWMGAHLTLFITFSWVLFEIPWGEVSKHFILPFLL